MAFTTYDENKSIWRAKADKPNDSATALKEDWDKLRNESVAAVNDLVGELGATSAAGNIGYDHTASGMTAATVKAALDELASEKVDAVVGKGLSTNDYDATEKASVASNTAARHSHTNQSTLDTYTQTEANLADAVTKKHAHANQATLDTYTQTEANLASAVTNNHTHSNKATLDTYTQTEANLASAVTNNHTHSNKTTLDSITAAYTTEEASKLAGIEASANNYTLPTASNSTLGGVKVDGTSITIADGVISSTATGSGDMAASTYDPTSKAADAFDSANHSYSNATSGLAATTAQGAIDELASEKVDKETGKVLSSNDYTDTEKTKLAGIAESANNYSLPTASTSVLGGVKVDGSSITITDGVISAPTGGAGDMLAATYDPTSKASDAFSASNHAYTNTTSGLTATTTQGAIDELASEKVDKEAGKVLSSNDYTDTEQTKLAGIAEGANNYTLPTASASVLGGVKVDGTTVTITDGVISSAGSGDMIAATYDPTSVAADAFDSANHSYDHTVSGLAATTVEAAIDELASEKVDKVTGKVLSSNDYTDTEKTKLAGIAESANNYSLPTASTSVLGGVKVDGTSVTISDGVISASGSSVSPYTSNPAMDGAASAGSSANYARGDHVHPSDTSRAASSHSHSGYAQMLSFTSKTVATTDFAADTTYTDYGYKADITCTGVTTDYAPTVIFGVTESESGNYAPVAASGTDKVTIYAKAVPSADITIPTIVCFKAVT